MSLTLEGLFSNSRHLRQQYLPNCT